MLANAAKYGIDPAKNCIAGCSGGGWIIAGAANLMAKANDLGKIKAVFIHTGMLSNASADIPEDQLQPYENEYGTKPDGMTDAFKIHATDFEN